MAVPETDHHSHHHHQHDHDQLTSISSSSSRNSISNRTLLLILVEMVVMVGAAGVLVVVTGVNMLLLFSLSLSYNFYRGYHVKGFCTDALRSTLKVMPRLLHKDKCVLFDKQKLRVPRTWYPVPPKNGCWADAHR